MNQSQYDKKFSFDRQDEDNWAKRKLKNFGTVLSRSGLQKAALRRLPIIGWLSRYSKSNAIADFVAGLTVGIYNVPQAMSYSLLAGLSPVYGLYASLFPPLLYSVFGTATHTSIGVFSITCLMVSKCITNVKKYAAENPTELGDISDIHIATSLCILTGLVQAVMAIFRCDKMMKFLSSPAISAITFSACFFGVVSQIPKLCGFSVPSRNEKWFSLFYSIEDLGTHCKNSNQVTLFISTCALVFLIFMKYIIDPQLKKHRVLKRIPISKELIVIIASTTASYFFDLKKRYGVKTIGQVPRGFPTPEIPRVDLWPHMVQDAVSIAVVAYAVTMSMGHIFSKKHKYRLDSNQELLALGLINVGSSFFSTFPTSASLSRTLVNESSGAKSQLSGIISALCILSVICLIGPLMQSLPSCVLAAIVLVVVTDLLAKITELFTLWKYSKHDFWIWVLTAAVTLISNIAQGVAAGIFFAIATIAIQSQQPSIKRLGQIRANDFRSIKHYGSAKETLFQIIRFDAPLIFANADKFIDNVRQEAARETTKKRSESLESQENNKWTAIILDCHTWIYTDSMGIEAVKEVDEDLKSKNILLLFANLKSSLRRQYEHSGVLKQITPRQLYPSIQDALDAAHQVAADSESFLHLETEAEKV